MISVLFVCLGNICRSPLAEGIFKDLVKKKGLIDNISIDSAGTGNYHIGADPDHRSIYVARKYDIELDHKARQFSKKDFDDFDYIIAMDQNNYDNIKRLKREASLHGKLFLMRAYDLENDSDMNVPDPYYGGLDGFEHVYQMLHRSCQALLDQIIKEHRLDV
jgi:protein-tyrosine phosphatase